MTAYEKLLDKTTNLTTEILALEREIMDLNTVHISYLIDFNDKSVEVGIDIEKKLEILKGKKLERLDLFSIKNDLQSVNERLDLINIKND